jgi:hypothetical protein
MFVKIFLFETVFGVVHSFLVALRQSVECFDATAFVHPVLLPCSRLLMGLSDDFSCLTDCSIQSVEKGLVIPPLIARKPVAGSGKKSRVILVAVLCQQFKALRGLLLTGDQLAEATRCFLQFHLGQIKDRLEREVLVQRES